MIRLKHCLSKGSARPSSETKTDDHNVDNEDTHYQKSLQVYETYDFRPLTSKDTYEATTTVANKNTITMLSTEDVVDLIANCSGDSTDDELPFKLKEEWNHENDKDELIRELIELRKINKKLMDDNSDLKRIMQHAEAETTPCLNNDIKFHFKRADKGQCRICGKNDYHIVKHYVMDHPQSEVFVSRLSEGMSSRLREDPFVVTYEQKSKSGGKPVLYSWLLRAL